MSSLRHWPRYDSRCVEAAYACALAQAFIPPSTVRFAPVMYEDSVALGLAVTVSSHAAGMGGHGSAGGRPGGDAVHNGFVGRHFDGHFDRHHDGRFESGFGFEPIVPYYQDDASGYDASGYWYYCPSYRTYYPAMTTCPSLGCWNRLRERLRKVESSPLRAVAPRRPMARQTTRPS